MKILEKLDVKEKLNLHFKNILRKFWRNFKKIKEKFYENFGKIRGNLGEIL